MLRDTIEKNARAQMAQCPGGLAQWPQTQPMLAPRMPQTVPPLHQPLPGWPATPTSRRYNHQRSPLGGELLLTPLQIKLLLGVVQVHRTMKDLPLEGGETVADPSVTPEVCRGRRVHSRCVRRAICPPGQCQVFHHQRHLKEPSLSTEVGQGPPSVIPHDWHIVHVLWVYYKYNVASFKEAEWARLKETFFAYFLQHKEEALGIKERCPIDYMAYIEDHFLGPWASTWMASGVASLLG